MNAPLNDATQTRYTVFNHTRCIAAGELPQIASVVQGVMRQDQHAQILAFADATGMQTDFNWQEVLQTLPVETLVAKSSADDLATEQPRKAGRPKLGVVAREVTLLPRHWEWLNQQSGGASVALRKLVEAARRDNEAKDQRRLATDATYRVMTAIAGNAPNFEEALRALYAGKKADFERFTADWPVDIVTYLIKLSANAFLPVTEIE